MSTGLRMGNAHNSLEPGPLSIAVNYSYNRQSQISPIESDAKHTQPCAAAASLASAPALLARLLLVADTSRAGDGYAGQGLECIRSEG